MTIEGNSINIKNGKVFVDGKDVTPEAKEITITVNGDIDHVQADVCQTISVVGDVGNIRTVSGDIAVTGKLNGSIQTVSGDVECRDVAGSISSVSGKIKHK